MANRYGTNGPEPTIRIEGVVNLHASGFILG